MEYNGLELNNYNENMFNKLYGNTLDKSYYVKPKVGQLKLLLNEIHFINEMINTLKTIENVIVAGGAPGNHYLILTDMYPDITFILYDLVAFHPDLSKKKNVVLNHEYITTLNISKIRYPNSLFISDLRSLEIGKQKNSFEGDSIYITDMYQQLALFQLSTCSACMLKFKIPYNFKMPYLSGTLFIQPFINSNELRLISYKHNNINQLQIYDGTKIDEHCQLINNYLKQHELKLSEDEKNFLLKYKLINNWDNIALYHILNDSNKIQFIEQILAIMIYKKRY